MGWKYEPVSHGWGKPLPYKNLEEFKTYSNGLGNLPFRDIELFFKFQGVRKLVEDRDWVRLFWIWKKDEAPKKGSPWVLDILTDFLYYAGVEFWEDLPDDFDIHMFTYSDCIHKE